jgi:hypothetical protein
LKNLTMANRKFNAPDKGPVECRPFQSFSPMAKKAGKLFTKSCLLLGGRLTQNNIPRSLDSPCLRSYQSA